MVAVDCFTVSVNFRVVYVLLLDAQNVHIKASCTADKFWQLAVFVEGSSVKCAEYSSLLTF